MRVAITRTQPDAEQTAERLRMRGGSPVIAPLLTIVPCAFDTNVSGAQALIFSSANGVRSFPNVQQASALKVLAVGDTTAETAREAGFQDVRSASGDVAALTALAASALDPAAGKIIHISGRHAAGDLAGELSKAGFTVERRIAYAAIAATELPPALTQPLDVILFHSARAAEVFVSLGAPNAAELTAACLSPAVAAKAEQVPWKRIIVAPAPREEALLDAALGG